MTFQFHIYVIGLLACTLFAGGARASLWSGGRKDLKGDFEIGHQLGSRLRDEAITRNRFYLMAKEELTFDLPAPAGGSGKIITITAAARAWAGKENEFDLRALSAEFSQEIYKVNVGFQEIAWGETFGFFIADIVNPRDYRDSLFNELAWIRVPVFALNGQLFLGKLTVQGVVTPVARMNRLSESGGGRFFDEPKGQAAEFGGRASFLFDFGLDLGFFYYRHYNRNPVYLLNNAGGTADARFVPVVRLVDTFGLTASQATGSFVFRADSVLHLQQPQQTDDFSAAPEENQWQAIFGGDLTAESGAIFGLQYHTDWTNQGFRHWASFLTRDRWLDGKFETEFFVFRGIGNSDLWFEPKLSWNASASLTVSVRTDLLSAGERLSDGVLSAFREEDRFLTWVTYRF